MCKRILHFKEGLDGYCKPQFNPPQMSPIISPVVIKCKINLYEKAFLKRIKAFQYTGSFNIIAINKEIFIL